MSNYLQVRSLKGNIVSHVIMHEIILLVINILILKNECLHTKLKELNTCIPIINIQLCNYCDIKISNKSESVYVIFTKQWSMSQLFRYKDFSYKDIIQYIRTLYNIHQGVFGEGGWSVNSSEEDSPGIEHESPSSMCHLVTLCPQDDRASNQCDLVVPPDSLPRTTPPM